VIEHRHALHRERVQQVDRHGKLVHDRRAGAADHHRLKAVARAQNPGD